MENNENQYPPIFAESSGSSIPKIEAGLYTARCIQMIELGTIETTYPGKKPQLQKKVMLAFELPEATFTYEDKDTGEQIEKARIVSKEFTLSMFESAGLRKFLKGWRGKDFSEEEAKAFNIVKLLGLPCNLSISVNEKGYGVVDGATTLKKGEKAPAQINKSSVLAFSKWDQQLFESLPEYVRKKIESSAEHTAMVVKDSQKRKPQPVPIEEIQGEDDFENSLPF